MDYEIIEVGGYKHCPTFASFLILLMVFFINKNSLFLCLEKNPKSGLVLKIYRNMMVQEKWFIRHVAWYELPQPASHVDKPLSALHSLDFLVCISFSSSYQDPLTLYAPKFPNLDSKSNNNDLHFYLYWQESPLYQWSISDTHFIPSQTKIAVLEGTW